METLMKALIVIVHVAMVVMVVTVAIGVTFDALRWTKKRR